MKIAFLTMGRTADKHLAALADDYAARISHYVPFAMEAVPELKNTKSLSAAEQKEREGALLLQRLHPGDYVVLLDESGREMRSLELAGYIERKSSQPFRRLVFIAGGPYGFSPAVYAKAGEKLSLSRLTFPHQLVRLIFLEQLYRAHTILRGEPYHHE